MCVFKHYSYLIDWCFIRCSTIFHLNYGGHYNGEGKRAVLYDGNPWPPAGCWQSFSHATGEELRQHELET